MPHSTRVQPDRGNNSPADLHRHQRRLFENLIDKHTSLLEGTVPDIFRKLFDTYGSITQQFFTATKAEPEATTYNHVKPILAIFMSIKEYVSMAEVVDASETPAQVIDVALIIVSHATIFLGDVRKCTTSRKPTRLGSSSRHTSRPHRTLSTKVTANSLGFHERANLATTLANQVIEELTAQCNPEVAALQLT